VHEVLRIGMQTAGGLAAAHAQGLVHRDVKPANILLENGIERVKLTDFGLARAAADAGLTQSGLVAGTPNYMAPEQARGESTDCRADLFSLGSTLYAMCTGHPPFRAESAVAVLRRVSDDTPRPVRAINPDVPEWLETIIAKLHAKDPAGRFQSAAEAADLLSRCLAHVQEPLTVPLPPELVSRSAGFDSRRKSLMRWGGAAVLFCAAIAAGALALWPKGTMRHATERGSVLSEKAAPNTPGAINPAWSGTDELERQLADVRGKAQAIDSDLHRSGDPQGHDPVSALARSLADRAGLLEREIAAGRGVKP